MFHFPTDAAHSFFRNYTPYRLLSHLSTYIETYSKMNSFNVENAAVNPVSFSSNNTRQLIWTPAPKGISKEKILCVDDFRKQTIATNLAVSKCRHGANDFTNSDLLWLQLHIYSQHVLLCCRLDAFLFINTYDLKKKTISK